MRGWELPKSLLARVVLLSARWRSAVQYVLGNPLADAIGLQPVSLRFAQPTTEAAFQKQLSSDIPRNIFLISLALVVIGLLCLPLVNSGYERQNEHYGAREVNKVCNGIAAAGGLICVVAGASTKQERFFNRLPPLALELGAMAFIAFLMCLGIAVAPWYTAKVLGYEPSEVLTGHFSDSHVMIVLTGASLMCHLTLAVRWCVVWLLEVWILLVYAVLVYCLGSPESLGLVNLLKLMGVVLFTAVGKRKLEVYERHLFISLISEKTLRYEREFQLNQLSVQNEVGLASLDVLSQLSHGDSATLASVPTSSAVFDGFQALSNIEDKLNDIIEVGKLEHWLLNSDDVRLMPKQVLGAGSYGIVVRGTFHGLPVAVKIAQDGVGSNRVRHLRAMASELRVLRQVRHPNIVLFHGACLDPVGGNMALVLELIEGKSLDDVLAAQDGTQSHLSESDRCRLLMDVCQALRYLHQRKPSIVHGDLKGENVLVEVRGRPRAKLADFGLSRVLTRNARPLGGSLIWMAPEVLQPGCPPPSAAADVFSFGRLVFFVVTQEPPLKGVSQWRLLRLIKSGRVPPLDWEVAGNTQWALRGQAVAMPCLAFEPAARPSMSQVQSMLEAWSDLVGAGPRFRTESETVDWPTALKCLREEPFTVATLGQADHAGEQLRPKAPLGDNNFAALVCSTPCPRLARMEEPHLEPVPEEEGLTMHQPPAMLRLEPVPEEMPEDRHVLFPHFRETPQVTQERLFFFLMQACNVRVLSGQCCKFHASLEALSRVHSRLMSSSCSLIAFPKDAVQCPNCFALLDADDDRAAGTADVACWICDGAASICAGERPAPPTDAGCTTAMAL